VREGRTYNREVSVPFLNRNDLVLRLSCSLLNDWHQSEDWDERVSLINDVACSSAPVPVLLIERIWGAPVSEGGA
jgi:hypothetical protein